MKLQESLGFAFSSKQLNNSKVLSVEVQKIIKIEDKYIDIANQQDNYIRKFLYTMDKAQTYRIANRRDLSLKVLNDILPWVKVEESEEVNILICTINVENDALEGRIDLGTIAERINQCNHTKHFKLSEQIKDVPLTAVTEAVISIFPNPVNDIANIRTNIENARLLLFDNVGRLLIYEKINFDSDIDLSSFSQGIYILKIENLDTSETYIKKLVVQ